MSILDSLATTSASLIRIITNTVAFACGAVFCLGFAAFFCVLLKNLARRNPGKRSDTEPLGEESTADTEKEISLTGLAIFFTALAYAFTVGRQFKHSDGLASAVSNSITTVLGVEIGVAITAGMGIGLFRLAECFLSQNR